MEQSESCSSTDTFMSKDESWIRPLSRAPDNTPQKVPTTNHTPCHHEEPAMQVNLLAYQLAYMSHTEVKRVLENVSPDTAVIQQEQRTTIKKRISAKAYKRRVAEQLSSVNRLELEEEQVVQEKEQLEQAKE